MKKVLTVAAVVESFTGVVLLFVPSPAARLLMGTELAGIPVTIARLTGIALIALGVACWPGTPLLGMLTYNALATIYLLFLGIRGVWAGTLLWPAVGLHGVMTLLLARAWVGSSRDAKRG